jgi:hypothetical protein
MLVLAALFEGVSTGLRGEFRTDQSTVALLLAQSKLATLGITDDLAVGKSTGSFENGMTWMMEVAPYASSTDKNNGRASVYWVNLDIIGGRDSKDAPILHLTTLKLASQNAR